MLVSGKERMNNCVCLCHWPPHGREPTHEIMSGKSSVRFEYV